VVKSSDVTLTREGNIWSGECPFHAGQNSALQVDPSTQHWQCDGSCQTGGSVVEWLMKTQGVSHVHATEMIRSGLDQESKAIAALNSTTVNKLAPPFASNDDDQKIVNYVIDYYHQTLKQSPEALTYLQKRKIDNSDAIEHFKLGFCN
jgi:DNA primase